MALRTGNPTLSETAFTSNVTTVSGSPGRMSLDGTVHRTFFLLCLVVAAASVVWNLVYTHPEVLYPAVIGSSILGFIVALVTCFKKDWSPYTAPLYAVIEGVIVGTISSLFEAMYPGIVIQAVALTFGTLFALLFVYRARLIRATENFKLGLFAATGGICLLYLVNMGLRLFASYSIPFIHESGTAGILFSLFVVVVAALNLVLDFDFIEQGVERGAPQYMEWYAAFGLLVTLIWLYLEILRLLAKLRSRD